MQIYRRICYDLAIDTDRDLLSSLILSAILGSSSSVELFSRFRGGRFYVVGNGPNLQEGLEGIENGTVIVADSALEAYMMSFPPPEIVVTDLDGKLPLLQEASDSGSLMVVHAHGDNIDLIREYAAGFTPGSVGTTQNVPLNNIFNFYGFTDGDRAAYLAHFLGAERIDLVGFDFRKTGSKQGTDQRRKMKKLVWAKILLENLARERGTSLAEGPIITL